jgi:type IX secretion system PorP/SprF family membrane protein
MKRFLLPAAIVIFLFRTGFGQDQEFTQFYATPISLNPALTGAFDGKYRLSFIYRDKWRNVLDNPYVTFAGAIDLRFGINYLKKRNKDAVGIGMLFYNDRNPGVDFYTNQILVSGAFHKSLSPRNHHFLSLGVQAGIAQRNVNYENLSFEDQFNGTDGYTGSTEEVLPENNFSYSDYSVGLNYSYAPARKTGIFAGVSLHHLMEPHVSFFFNPDRPEEYPQHKLHRKYTAHLSFQIPVGPAVQILPRAVAYKQGPHMMLNAGSNIRFLINDINGVALHVGSWVRPVSDNDEKWRVDSVVGLIGIEISNFLVGLSYDAALNKLNLGRRTQGAFELSIAYLGEYENETVQCPRF